MVGTDFFVNVKTANTFKYNYCTHFLRCPKYEQFIIHLSHFKTMFPFYTSGKHQKTFKFLTLLGGTKCSIFPGGRARGSLTTLNLTNPSSLLTLCRYLEGGKLHIFTQEACS